MKVLLDACVLYPTVMREVLLAAAGQGLFQPQWSERILEEWARAARKLGPEGEMIARGEVAQAQAAWPRASVKVPEGLEARLYLPDPNDVHVLAAAIAGSADLLLTLNAKDFPRRTLSDEGVARQDPDGFLMDLWMVEEDRVEAAVAGVVATASRMLGAPQDTRGLLKKARLPRLGKALSGGSV